MAAAGLSGHNRVVTDSIDTGSRHGASTHHAGIAAPGPSGRSHDTENFPTASLLLAPAVRARVMAFYRFVRTADDIADSASLDAGEKLSRLGAMGRALDDPRTAMPEAAALHRTAAGTEEARRMLSAFLQDATKRRYGDWAELEGYCAMSANPVGRLLFRLHGVVDARAAHAADGLSTALQVLNHLQDLVPDRDALDRVYLPGRWMALAGGEAAFFDPGNSGRRRAVLDAVLDQVEEQIDRATSFPRRIASTSRRLAIQSAMTVALARKLLARLRAADPVVGRVSLSKADFAVALLSAPALGPSDAALVAARVKRAGSTFARGMATLKGERRRALWAVYAFCRAVDDIADGAMPEFEKRRFLAGWRSKLTAPNCALSRELALACQAFAVPLAECEAMIAGMETDAGDSVRLADEVALDLYCRQVAGSVGAMSVRIFGAPEAEAWGLALGRTFQLTNVLRDVDEDAARNRVYVPRSMLEAAGIDADSPATDIVADPRFPAICDRLARVAREGFEQAERELPARAARALRPARVMMWGYKRLLDAALAAGFAKPRARVRLSRGQKLRMAAFAVTGR